LNPWASWNGPRFTVAPFAVAVNARLLVLVRVIDETVNEGDEDNAVLP
jgi:hypothetical protein